MGPFCVITARVIVSIVFQFLACLGVLGVGISTWDYAVYIYHVFGNNIKIVSRQLEGYRPPGTCACTWGFEDGSNYCEILGLSLRLAQAAEVEAPKQGTRESPPSARTCRI